MLRLVHNQVGLGSVLINDIDDGLPNKTARRLVAPPSQYERDGYANKTKQKCYLPYKDATDPTMKGYIDLTETDRVLMSQNSGTIAGLVKAGLITATHFISSDVAAPTLTTAQIGAPTTGDLTLTGTNFTSLSPFTTSVILTGTGARTLTQAAILGGGGSISNTSIVIPAALVPSIAATSTSAQVKADNQTSSVVAVTT